MDQLITLLFYLPSTANFMGSVEVEAQKWNAKQYSFHLL